MFLFNFHNVTHSVTWAEHYGIAYKSLFELFHFAYFVGLKFNAAVMVKNALKERLD